MALSHLDDPAAREKVRSKLEAMKERALKRRRNLKEWGIGEGSQETAQELSSIDQHTADHGTETFERARDLGLMEEARIEYDEILAALERLERGEYGQCASCGRPIPAERLDALPTARLCVACAREQEGQGPESASRALRRDVSPGTREGWRSPAFSRKPHQSPWLEEEGRQEAWEALGDYPSANSPQDEPDRALDPREP